MKKQRGPSSADTPDDNCLERFPVADSHASTCGLSFPSNRSSDLLLLDYWHRRPFVCSIRDRLPTSSAVCVTALMAGLAGLLLVCFQFRRRERTKKIQQTTDRSSQRLQLLERKQDFLARAGSDYGYRNSPCGYIDAWRLAEFPGLIAPTTATREDTSKPSTCNYFHFTNETVDNNTQTETQLQNLRQEDDERQVYLDYAGAALPRRSQLDAMYHDPMRQILGNPHSTGPAAAQTMRLLEQAKKRVLDHFHGYGGQVLLSGRRKMENDATTSLRSHPGYQVLFTSGATEALRIVAEHFPWSRPRNACRNGCPGLKSLLMYPQNAHTSVIGMRAEALAQGASFVCAETSKCYVEQLVHSLQRIEKENCVQCQCHDETIHHLVVLTPECNFGGDRLADVPEIVARLHSLSTPHRHITILMDLSKAASTGPVDLCQMDADLACVSFYKLFGEPTGVGSLLVKQSSVDRLFSGNIIRRKHCRGRVRRYFGGGSVDIALPADDFTVVRTEGSPLAKLVHGTCNFRGIASLVHGFDTIDKLGGMDCIQRHTTCLAVELVRRLRALVHWNGKPAIILYGDWKTYDTDCINNQQPPGPTLAFNIVRDDGSFVGYNEVSKLAALNRPPIQLRTGCFCNPGACQEALELLTDDVRHNYEEAGHVCGDQVDIINGKPTGAVRVSFGKDSTWEDLDALVSFLKRTFVSETRPAERSWEEVAQEVLLSELYVFPIKSCAAQRVHRWKMVAGGRLEFDREFSLVDSSGVAMRLQSYPKMAFLRPEIDVDSMTMRVSAPGCNDLVVELVDDDDNKLSSDESQVKVCGNKCGGTVWGDAIVSVWFSHYLGVRCWLARYVGDAATHSADDGNLHKRYLRSPEVAFANEQPLLLISEHAVDRLNSVLKSQQEGLVSSRHFRPNFVTRLVHPTGIESVSVLCADDYWSKLSLVGKSLTFEVTGPCARCSMVDIDPTSGMKGHTLRALAEHRRYKGQITFGIFLRVTDHPKRIDEDAMWISEGDVLLCE